MSEHKENVPKIRFPGFTDAWEQLELSDVANVMDGDRGKNYPSGDDFSVQGHTLFLNATNVTKDGFSFGNDQYITEEKSNTLGNGKIELNDIVLTSRGSLGHVAWYDTDIKSLVPFARINSGMLILRSKEDVEPSYIAQYLKSPAGKRQIDLISFGSAQPQLTKKDVSNYKIFIPEKAEQSQLGELFTQLDHLITLHQRKLNNVRNLKDGLLQKMFPKNGEDFPEIRFPEFTGAWEQQRLGEVAEFNPKSMLPDEFEYVDLESVVGTNLIAHRTESKESAPSRAQRLAQCGDVFYQTVRPYQKNNYLYELPYDNYVFSTGYAQMRPSIDSYFLLSHVQEELFVKTVLDRSTGTSYPSINSNDLAEIEIKIPIHNDEQLKIGSLFRNLDHLITLHQRKLQHLQEQKKALLQQMFI
ncbi:EcoKI restriction-modification system protein HsdS [compost metagenome]